MNKKLFLALFLTLIAFSILIIQNVSFGSTSCPRSFKCLPSGYAGPPAPVKTLPLPKPKSKGCIVEYDKKAPAKKSGCLEFYEND